MLQAANGRTIIVAAASDLAPIEQQMKDLAPKLPLKFVFGSSGQLASQIRGGAPYDVYLSANLDFVRALETEGRLVVGSVRQYARGRLALYSRDGKVTTLEQLAGVRNIAIANPAHAPYGVAAKQVLPAGLGKKIVYAENVRQALQFAESGNAEAAIVSKQIA